MNRKITAALLLGLMTPVSAQSPKNGFEEQVEGVSQQALARPFQSAVVSDPVRVDSSRKTSQSQPIPADSLPRDAQRIFITSGVISAEMGPGGLASGDQFCQNAARTAGRKGTWRAILSTTGMGAKDRLDIHGPVYQIGFGQDGKSYGALIANDSRDLWKGTIQGAIAFNEFGQVVSYTTGDDANVLIWTGSDAVGKPLGEFQNQTACADWTNFNMFTNWTNNGIVGQVSSDGTWLQYEEAPCNLPHHLYCIDGQNDAKPDIKITDIYYEVDPQSGLQFIMTEMKNEGKGIGRGWLHIDYATPKGSNTSWDRMPMQVPLPGKTDKRGFEPYMACMDPQKDQPVTVTVTYKSLDNGPDIIFPSVTKTVRVGAYDSGTPIYGCRQPSN